MGTVTEVADLNTGSSNPTYWATQKRMALTAGKRRLIVHGKHADGVQLAWRDPSGSWSTVSRGSVTDGRILSGQGSGDINAAIAIAKDSGGNEVAVVVCASPFSSGTRALELRRITDLDNPLGPQIGALVTLDAGGASAGNSKPDIGMERTAGGVERLCVVWLKQTAATPTFDLKYGWLTDLTTDTLAFSTTGNLIGASTSGSRQGNLIEKPADAYNGLGFASRNGTASATTARLFQRSSADALTTWSESVAGGTTASASQSSGVRLGTEWITAQSSNTSTGVVVLERYNNDGSTRTLDVTTATGYFDPVVLTDGTSAYVLMRKGPGDATDVLVSRKYTPGSGWGDDVTELSGHGGIHLEPNGLRDGSRLNGIVFAATAAGLDANHRRVLVVESLAAAAPAVLERPPLALNAEVTDANGTQHRWGSDERPEDRPQNVTFSTKRGEGFDRGGLTLPRRTDRDFPDLGLKNDVALVGAEGSVAYEGRIASTPRSGLHSIEVQTAGWMSHARQRKFTEIYVDRDLGAWGPLSNREHIARALLGYAQQPHRVEPDSSGVPALVLAFQGAWASPALPAATAKYDAGPGNKVKELYFDWANLANTTVSAPWAHRIYGSNADDSDGSWAEGSGNADLFGVAGYKAFTSAYRWAIAELRYDTTGAGTNGLEYGVRVRKLAVYGDHGLTRQGTAPGGFYASDVIKHIAGKYCPKLSVAGVKDTSFPITHLPFRERIFPYEAWQQINKHHIWALAVWEKRTLHYEPFDLIDYDWQVRNGEDGVSIDLQGDSTDTLANGIAVTYFDVEKGATNVLTPDTHAELADDSVEHPSNQWGEDDWTELPLSFPATEDIALQVGRAALAEFNTPKAPGTIRTRGYIRDRAGHWQPVWKVRADDTIAVVNHPNDRPRLIHETTYNHSSKELTIAVEGTMPRLDAYYDRVATAFAAENVSV